MTIARRRPHRRPSLRATAGVVALACGASGLAACGAGASGADSAEAGADRARVTAARWDDGSLTTSRTLVRGEVQVSGARRVTIDFRNAYPFTIPEPCVQSTVKALRSYLSGRTMVCTLSDGVDAVPFVALVDGADGSTVGGTVLAHSPDGDDTSQLPSRAVLGGPRDTTPDLRLVSSPDFLNADVADLRKGPGRWTRKRSTNGTSPAYEKAIGGILDDWAALDPAAVLVAGDLVNGRWGFDDQRTGTFGPVRTLPQRARAIQRAARTYYPQWKQRFAERGLEVFPTIGDHEFGDSPFFPGKRILAPVYRQEFARQFTRTPDGRPRYAAHPRSGPARHTAWAARPAPDVQVVSLDVFDITPKRARIRLDRAQMRWLETVLARARRDQVRWVVVEGHVPILFPVRTRGSSALHYEGGARSKLWKVLQKYGVDLYLSGEVHDTQLEQRDGIVQISHGGAFQFGLTTAMVMDFHGDRLHLTLRDYDIRHREGGRYLWETQRRGLAPDIRTGHGPKVIGTATLGPDGLDSVSGILTPVD